MSEKYKFWLDKKAEQIIERENKLKRNIKIFRCESGLGASGFPHIGSFGDVIRNYAVSLALKEKGVKTQYIAYSDDRDGLRKIPLTLPNWLEKHIGQPVTDIPDPFGCHNSYGNHMSSLLTEVMDTIGIKYKFRSATEDYKKGVFDNYIQIILENSKNVAKIIKETLGQEKFEVSLPYFPVCENCGKIYTTRCYEVDFKSHKVFYVCDQEFVGKNLNTGQSIVVKGCGYKGEASYFKGSGKVSWKAEFAMRWAALKIVFEAYGKDIRDSVIVNDKICKEVLNFEPPLHVMYEMFLDKSGKKISKSYGNVFTPQVWLKYGSKESLVLLLLKRFEGARELDVTDIPKYMDELNELEKIYFDMKKLDNPREIINSKRLFEYVHFLKKPKKPSLHINYSTWLEIAKILPEKNQVEFAINKLKEFGYLKKPNKKILNLVNQNLNFAKRWLEDFAKSDIRSLEMSEEMKVVLKEFIEIIKKSENGEKLQEEIFNLSRKHKIDPPTFFKTIYQILLNSEKGPRLGPYIIERGKEEVINKIEESIK